MKRKAKPKKQDKPNSKELSKEWLMLDPKFAEIVQEYQRCYGRIWTN